MTPGPWMVIPKGGPQGPFYGAMNNKGNVVALQIVSEPDAHLIAAAPDLYAALKRFLSADEPTDAAAEIEMAEAALRKAEGRA